MNVFKDFCRCGKTVIGWNCNLVRRLLMKMWLFAKSCKYYEIHTWKGRRLNSPANNAWYIHALLIYTKICTRTEWSLLNKIWLLCTYCLRYGHFLHCAKFQQWLSDVTHTKHFLLVILYCYAVFLQLYDLKRNENTHFLIFISDLGTIPTTLK